MSTTASCSEITPRKSDTETESERIPLPETEKLPTLDTYDPNFEELNDVPEDYHDPIRVHQMLIDERMMASRNQVEFATLNEELQRLKNELNDAKSRKKVEFTDDRHTAISQAEKDEIDRLQRELQSTKIKLADLEASHAQSLPEYYPTPFADVPPGQFHADNAIPPAEIEMVRAAVIHENKTKYNFESLATIEAEIEKYRNLYNDIRSKFTILNGDFEHAKLEHKDELDSIRYRHHVELVNLTIDKDNYKVQNEEIKNFAHKEIDLMKNEMKALNAKITSLTIEKDAIDENRRDRIIEMDAISQEREQKLTDLESDLKSERNSSKRINDLLSNRETEISDLNEQMKLIKIENEKIKRENDALTRSNLETCENHDNTISIIQAKLEKEVSCSKIELEKWKISYRKCATELELEKKKSSQRSKIAEQAEANATEKINDVKTEQWAIIEKLKSEKRDLDSTLQKEIDKKQKFEHELSDLKENIKSEKLEWERSKLRLENQASLSRDEKAKLLGELKESQIKNEQIVALKKSVEDDQKEKHDLVRQIHERDLSIKENGMIKESLNKEISTLRHELQLSLEEAKRNKEEDRINFMEEKNRLNQRIDQIEGRNQNLLEKISTADRDIESIKKKYSAKLKVVNDENLKLKAQKDKLQSQMELDQRTRGVSREEYDKVKRRADIMKKRMASFAMAIKSSENIPITLSESSFAGSPRKVASDISLVDLGEINRRLDQIELDQFKQDKIFKENKKIHTDPSKSFHC